MNYNESGWVILGYTLYLDESEIYNTQKKKKYYIMAGFILKDEFKDAFEKDLNNLKYEIWIDKSRHHNIPTLSKRDIDNICLHESNIQEASKKKKRNLEKAEYNIFKKNDVTEFFYDELEEIFKKYDCKVIGSSINSTNYYSSINSEYNKNNIYRVLLGNIIDNYVQFLLKFNSKGNIIIEGRGDTENDMLANKYYSLLANGGRLYNSETIRKILTGINFYSKLERNIFLQAADFIPFPAVRQIAEIKKLRYSLSNYVRVYRWCGGIEKRDIYGINTILDY